MNASQRGGSPPPRRRLSSGEGILRGINDDDKGAARPKRRSSTSVDDARPGVLLLSRRPPSKNENWLIVASPLLFRGEVCLPTPRAVAVCTRGILLSFFVKYMGREEGIATGVPALDSEGIFRGGPFRRTGFAMEIRKIRRIPETFGYR